MQNDIIKEWVEVGGVLGYDAKRNGEVTLYIMDEGEFNDKWNDSCPNITKDEFAKLLCGTALEFAGYTKEEIEVLLNW